MCPNCKKSNILLDGLCGWCYRKKHGICPTCRQRDCYDAYIRKE